ERSLFVRNVSNDIDTISPSNPERKAANELFPCLFYCSRGLSLVLWHYSVLVGPHPHSLRARRLRASRGPQALSLFYSRRSASIGSSAAARIAGYSPKNRPTSAVIPTPMATDQICTEAGS